MPPCRSCSSSDEFQPALGRIVRVWGDDAGGNETFGTVTAYDPAADRFEVACEEGEVLDHGTGDFDPIDVSHGLGAVDAEEDGSSAHHDGGFEDYLVSARAAAGAQAELARGQRGPCGYARPSPS